MSAEEYESIHAELIWKLCEELDGVYPLGIQGPGVYYMAVSPHGEFYIVEQSSPVISDRVKSYGKQHPGYVLAHNLREQLGANDILYRLLGQLGVKAEPNISADNMITLFPDTGIEYIKF